MVSAAPASCLIEIIQFCRSKRSRPGTRALLVFEPCAAQIAEAGPRGLVENKNAFVRPGHTDHLGPMRSTS